MDGTDKFNYTLSVPPISTHSAPPNNQYFFAGGSVSQHTSEKHIALVKAENARISWRLGSLNILNGIGRVSL